MASAEIRTSSGAVVTVDGTSDEVNEIMRFWQMREDRFKHRRARFQHYDERFVNSEREKVFFSGSDTPRGPKAIVMELIDKNFFDDYQELSDIREEVEKKYKTIIPNSSLHPTLMLLIAQEKLIREIQKNGRWGYKIKIEGEKGEESIL